MKNFILIILLVSSSLAYSSTCEDAMSSSEAISNEKALQQVREWLYFDYYDLRKKERAIEATKRMGDQAFPILLPILQNALLDNSPITQNRAIGVVAEIGEPALPLLKQKEYWEDLDNFYFPIRLRAVNLSEQLGTPLALPVLEKAMKKEDPMGKIHLRAVEVANKLGESTFPILIRALSEKNNLYTPVILRIFEVLTKNKDQAIPALEKALESSDMWVRIRATVMLAKFGTPTLPLLKSKGLPALQNDLKMPHVPDIVFNSLAEIGEPAIPLLEEALESSDMWVRVRASKALIEIGTPSLPLIQSKVIPALERILNHTSYTANRMAEDLLGEAKDLLNRL